MIVAHIWITLLLKGLPWKRMEQQRILLFLRLHPSTAFQTLFNLTFQVPIQYCSLQHQTILPSPVTSTAGHCFRFDYLSLFLLELFLHPSSVAYWASTNLGVLLSLSYFLPFHTVHGVLKTRILK